MKAVVFAAGIGSRLKPFTDAHPKALAPVAGVPALERVIVKLVNAGAEAIIVNIHHFPQQIRDFIASHDFGVPVEISDESDLLLDTGGALAKMKRESNILANVADVEPIMVHNADIITDFPVEDMQSVAEGGDATILVDSDRSSSRYFLFNDECRLCGWINTKTGQVRPYGISPETLRRAAFGGVHVINGRTLSLLDDYCGPVLRPFGIVDFYLDNCRQLDIKAYVPSGKYSWFDIGTTEKLEKASAAMQGK